MKEINIREYYEEYGLYNTNDIINNFDKIYGISLPNLTSNLLLTNKRIIPKSKIINYYKKDDNIELKIRDYNIISKKINIYKQKGLKLLDILIYLKSNKKDKEYEELLTKLDIKHYNSIICGRDASRILETLNNIINEYNNNMQRINDIKTYNHINYDNLAITSNKLYPNYSLENNENNHDKTSLSLTRRLYKY